MEDFLGWCLNPISRGWGRGSSTEPRIAYAYLWPMAAAVNLAKNRHRLRHNVKVEI